MALAVEPAQAFAVFAIEFALHGLLEREVGHVRTGVCAEEVEPYGGCGQDTRSADCSLGMAAYGV